MIGLGVAAAVSVSAAAEPFYQGKRLAVLVNYAPGGPTDIEGRLFAKHIGRHIDGQPAVLVQNMDGAGGLVGTSYLGEIAPRDGSMMGYLTGAAWTYASDPDKYRVDLRSYEFIAYQPGTVVYYVRSDVEPGMKEATDIVKAQGPHLRRSRRRQRQGPADPPHARHAGRTVPVTSPAIAATRRRGSQCSATRSASSPNRRPAIAAWWSRAWSRLGW